MEQRFTPEQIVNTVCKTLELDFDTFRSKVRTTSYVDGRFIAAYLIRQVSKQIQLAGKIPKETRYTNPELQKLLNSASHLIYEQQRKCKILLDRDKPFRDKFERVCEALRTQV
jgi:hypothetical protein